MDYQAFSSQQPQFGGFNVTSSAPSPQAGLHPQAQFQQQQSAQFQYGQYANNGNGTSQGFPGAGGMVGHGAGSGGAPMNMMQPMQAGGMQRGERVT